MKAGQPQLRYSAEELQEFEELIYNKLDKSRGELEHLKQSILRESGDSDAGRLRSLDDGADSFEKEYLNQLAARTQKFINQLEKAAIRVKNGTYGICVDTGQLIPKDRLRAVPHTQHSIEAKMSQR